MPNRPPVPTPLRKWLADERDGPAGRLLSQAARLARLTQELNKELPAGLRGHWQLARVDQNALSIVTEGPAWTTQLRFYQEVLLEAAQRTLQVRPRTVHIRSGAYRPAPRPRLFPKATMTQETVDLIASCAASTDDARLSQSLQRLARAGAKKKQD